MYVNVVFPLKIPPLTYKAPYGAPADLRGRIVRAPLMGRSIRGLVMSTSEKPEMLIKKDIREIQEIYQNVMSTSGIAFLQWLADYYLTPVGTALRSSFFEEIASIVTQGTEEQAAEGGPGGHAIIPCESADNAAVSAICTSISKHGYRSFLYRAESSGEERALLISALTRLKDSLRHAVILAPEIAHLEYIVSPLKDLFGERVCVLHSKLSRKETAAALKRIITDVSDIVVGTRSAILAPLRKVSFIAVLAEHSRSYKAEEGLRYSGRDIAVMRGFHEKACVLLSSICPSVESVYNVSVGKYVMLENDRHMSKEGRAERPKIKIIAMGGARGDRMILASEPIKEAKRLASLNERFLFLSSRKGYSLLRCEDCGFVERCGLCDVPLVFHKGEDVLKCQYCGSAEKSSVSCSQCGGTAIGAYGAGTERVKEQVEKLLKAEALLVEKGRSVGRVITEDGDDLAALVVGTSYAKGLAYKKSAEQRPFGAAAFLNTDALLLQPDFRLYERAFQEIITVAQLVKRDGTVFLQTKMPQNNVLRFIRAYDFDGFYRYELEQRKAFNNPPYTKLVLFTVPFQDVQKEPGRVLDEMQRAAGALSSGTVEVLGPVELPYHSKKYHRCIQLLLKSKDRNALHDAARAVLKGLGKIKGAKIVVEVDPLKI
ncbi:MAG: primosomal protein N' [Dissulfurispiraceae bacterium]